MKARTISVLLTLAGIATPLTMASAKSLDFRLQSISADNSSRRTTASLSDEYTTYRRTRGEPARVGWNRGGNSVICSNCLS